jgi:hypothetical protein
MDVPVVIYCDNISNILFANNSFYHARTKHIEEHYHFMGKKILAKEIDLIHVNIKDQVANIFLYLNTLVLMVWFSFLHCTSLCISCDKNLKEFLMLCFVL